MWSTHVISLNEELFLLFGGDFLPVDEPGGGGGALDVGRVAVAVHDGVAAGAERGEASRRTREEVVHEAAAEVEPEATERIENVGGH